MASLKDTYFLVLNQPGNLQGGTSVVSASGFGILLGATGSVNFGNSTQFFSGYDSTDPFGSSILGGDRNAISGSNLSTVVGGQCNISARGYWNVIAGGVGNLASGGSNFIGAGQYNRIDNCGVCGFIGGGGSNRVYSKGGTIVNAEDSRSCSYLSWVGGGRQNCAGDTSNNGLGGAWYSVVVGGAYNHAAGFMSSIFHGVCNRNSGENSFIGAGSYNFISGIEGRPCDNVVVGGIFNRIVSQTGSFGNRSNQSSIVGGNSNSICGYSPTSAILGGSSNQILNSRSSTIDGGSSNVICNNINGVSTILGGYSSLIDGAQNSGSAGQNTIMNGAATCIIGSQRAVILSSSNSRICYANYGSIFGGTNTTIQSGHDGAMILSDAVAGAKNSSGSNTLLLDFNNGIYFNKTGIFGLLNLSTRPRVNGTGVLLSGEAGALPTTIVYTTGNQNISGSKTFNTRPNVNGTGVLLVGEESNVSVQNIVYTTGYQEIDGIKNFYTTPQVNDTDLALVNNVVDLANYQEIDGLKYFYTTPQVNGTDVALSNNVVDLSSSQNVDGVKDFYIAPQVNGTPVATLSDLGSLVNTYQNQNVDGIKNFSSRPQVNNVGVLLIGEAGGGQNVVYTTGNQVITGNKTFDHSSITTISNLAFRSTSGQLKTFSFVQQSGTLTQQIDYINENVWIARGSAYGIYNPQFENGWNSSVSPQGTMWNLDGWNDLSNLDSRNYSGFYNVNGGQLAYVTGKNFIMKDEVSDRYYKIYFTGWQVHQGNAAGYRGFGYTRQEVGPRAGALLSGQAVFDQRPIVSGKSVLIEGDIQGGGLVSTTGNQNISGLKNFFTRPTINSTGVLLFGEGSPSPIEIYGNGSSQGNASSLNFAGGGVSVNTVGAQATITVGNTTQVQTAPTSSNSAGVSGAFSFDKNYLYYCIENNQWIRTALSTW